MNGIQLDLFTFAAMQTQEKSAEAKPTVVLKNFINDGKYPIPTAKSERIAANLKAIRLLKSLSEERPLEYDEQITLSRFTGWGGLTDVFMEDDPHFAELKELLTKEEYETAESSMLDSYYTSENIIDFMWTLARQKLGIKTGKVAELGCGTGNFIGYAPMQKGYQFTGVEIDKISGNIARRLYPESTIHINSLEKVKLSNNFDLVIGNVPFGRFAPYDPQFRSYNSWNLHNYFIAKALDLLKAGGHLVVLTSSSTMDQPGSMANILMQKAGVVEAYRLPKNTFAGTEVVADILIIKKGFTEDLSGNLKTVETSDNTGTVEINSYFAKHQEHIFGTLSKTGRMYGKTDTTTVLPGEKSLDECFSEIMAEKKNTVVESAIEKSSSPETDLFGNVVIDTPKNKTVNIGEIPETVDAPLDAKEYTIFCTQHGVYQVIEGVGRRMKDRKGEDLSAKEIKKITSFVAIKETLNRLIAAQLDFNATDTFIEQLRNQLKWQYEDHVVRYDVLSNRTMHRFCTEDPEYNKVAAIENCKKVSVVNKAGVKTTKNVYEPGDILFKRTQYPWKEPDHADDIVAAGLISNAYRNCIDLSYIGQMTGKTPEEAKTALLASKEYFFDPATKQIMLKSRYLSGNIKRKIADARLHGLDDNVAALQEVLPKPLTIEDIDFALGAFWLPQSVVEKWVAKDLNGKVEIICQNGEFETNEWASKSIGQEIILRKNKTYGDSKSSSMKGDDNKSLSFSEGYSEQKDYRVDPADFSTLQTGGPRGQCKVGFIFWQSGRILNNGSVYVRSTIEQQCRRVCGAKFVRHCPVVPTVGGKGEFIGEKQLVFADDYLCFIALLLTSVIPLAGAFMVYTDNDIPIAYYNDKFYCCVSTLCFYTLSVVLDIFCSCLKSAGSIFYALISGKQRQKKKFLRAIILQDAILGYYAICVGMTLRLQYNIFDIKEAMFVLICWIGLCMFFRFLRTSGKMEINPNKK